MKKQNNLNEKPLTENPLLSNGDFLGCNDAPLLIATFIRAASVNEQEAIKLFNALRSKLNGKNHNPDYSQKVKNVWNVCVLVARNDLVNKTTSAGLRTRSVLVKPKFDSEKFLSICALEPKVQAPQQQNVRKSTFTPAST